MVSRFDIGHALNDKTLTEHYQNENEEQDILHLFPER